VNVLTAALQLFLVSRILKWFDTRGALLFLPTVALAGYAAVLFVPILSVIRVAKILENSVDYSVQNTARQALFLPTERDDKYKAKQAIDSFFVRFGDMLSFGVVYTATTVLQLGVAAVAVVNVVLVGIWFLLIWGIANAAPRSPASTPARSSG
jgi:AAA family ATP:ADP antiporter